MFRDNIQMEESWKRHLLPEFGKPYMKSLKIFLQAEQQKNHKIYPRPSEYFQALAKTPVNKVKIVILGQDPYHGEGQAHGLCFSVKPYVPIPPSLKNIYKELKSDLGFSIPNHGFLESWADQGVLLLNSILTVRGRSAGSHQEKGWERFTDAILKVLNENRSHLVFLLWGAYAQKKACFIDKKNHLLLEAPHPSPLSAHRGFIGCKHFSRANKYLIRHKIGPIDWDLDNLLGEL